MIVNLVKVIATMAARTTALSILDMYPAAQRRVRAAETPDQATNTGGMTVAGSSLTTVGMRP